MMASVTLSFVFHPLLQQQCNEAALLSVQLCLYSPNRHHFVEVENVGNFTLRH